MGACRYCFLVTLHFWLIGLYSNFFFSFCLLLPNRNFSKMQQYFTLLIFFAYISTATKLRRNEDATYITIRHYTGDGATACTSSSYNTTKYTEGNCTSADALFSCQKGMICVQTLLYSGMGCSGSVTVSTAQVCDVCMGSSGMYMKYTGCDSGNVKLTQCSDSQCQSCTSSFPYPTGCNGFNNVRTVSCSAVSIRTYSGGSNCSGAPILKATIGADVCEGGLEYQCY